MGGAFGYPVVRAPGAHGKTAARLATGGALAFRGPGRPCGQRRGNRFGICCARSRFAGRASCAPQWQVNACAPGKCSAKARGSAPGYVRSTGYPVVRA